MVLVVFFVYCCLFCFVYRACLRASAHAHFVCCRSSHFALFRCSFRCTWCGRRLTARRCWTATTSKRRCARTRCSTFSGGPTSVWCVCCSFTHTYTTSEKQTHANTYAHIHTHTLHIHTFMHTQKTRLKPDAPVATEQFWIQRHAPTTACPSVIQCCGACLFLNECCVSVSVFCEFVLLCDEI